MLRIALHLATSFRSLACSIGSVGAVVRDMAHMAAGAVATLGGRFELLGPILAEQTESISAPPAKSARKSIASSIECVDRIYGSKS